MEVFPHVTRKKTYKSTSVTYSGRDVLPSNTGKVYLAGLITNYCVFCIGTAFGWRVAGEDSILNNNAYRFTPTTVEWRWTCLCLYLGVIIFCIPMGALMKYHGCKALMLIQIVPYILGCSLLKYANNSYMLCVGRFLQGICGAALSLAVPVYSEEICLVRQRGALCSMFFGALAYGIIWTKILVQFCGLAFANTANLCLSIFLLSLMIIPESPAYYVSRRDTKMAIAALHWFRGKNYNVYWELHILTKADSTTRLSNPNAGCWATLVRTGILRSVSRATVMLILHNIIGGVIIIGYLKDTVCSISESWLRYCLIFLCLCLIIGHTLCFTLVDRIGRIPLLLGSSIIITVSSLYLGYWFKWGNAWRWSPILSMYILTIGYTLGFGPVSWILYAELISAPNRPYGCAFALICSWLPIILLYFRQFFGIDEIRIFSFIIIASMVGFIFVIVLLFETKNMTTRQIRSRLASTSRSRWDSYSAGESV